MSEKPSPWSEVLSGIFAILTAIATYLGTQPFNTLFAVLLGATVTYAVQKRLQRDSEKRSKNAEYVEKYYAPLLVEIQKIQETILNNVSEHYDLTSFKGFKAQPQFYTMGKKLRADFLVFADKIVKLGNKISFYRGKIKDLIREMGKPYLVNPPGEVCNFVPDQSYSPIYIKYYRESDLFRATLDDCILQGKKPVDVIKDKVTNFQEQSIEVEFCLHFTRETGGSRIIYDCKSFPERVKILSDIVSKVNIELNKDVGYKNFQSELSDLRHKAESLSTRLTKYVEEYVSIVDI